MWPEHEYKDYHTYSRYDVDTTLKLWGEFIKSEPNNEPKSEKRELLEEFLSNYYAKELLEKEDYNHLYEMFQSFLKDKNLAIGKTSYLTEALMKAEIDFIPKLDKVYAGMNAGLTLNESYQRQMNDLLNRNK